VAIARALINQPGVLLLDEPLAALDVHSRGEVRSFLAAYLEKIALPTIVVTHDAADARLLGQRIAVLEGGRITQVGTWQELSATPCTRFVEEFVASA
jgi:molybdate transport system ATP-binding protein